MFEKVIKAIYGSIPDVNYTVHNFYIPMANALVIAFIINVIALIVVYKYTVRDKNGLMNSTNHKTKYMISSSIISLVLDSIMFVLFNSMFNFNNSVSNAMLFLGINLISFVACNLFTFVKMDNKTRLYIGNISPMLSMFACSIAGANMISQFAYR